MAISAILLVGVPQATGHGSAGHAPAASVAVLAAPALRATDIPGDEWPMFMSDITHGSRQTDPESLNASTAPHLTLQWKYQAKGQIVSEPIVHRHTVYFGSFDGYEHALNSANGTLRWATYTGQSSCLPHTHPVGVASTAAIVNGTLYVGGGKDYWYALSPTNGSVLWKIYTGNSNSTVGGGHYNWASPLVYGKYAYVGIASHCDLPLVQGQLLQVDLTNRSISRTFNTTTPGNLGAGIWSSPAINPATNTIYLATGNLANGTNATLDDSILGFNATTLALQEQFQVPYVQRIPDGDFGASVTLFQDQNGTPRVGDVDKNGVYFALDQGHLARGEVWQSRIAYNETFSSAAFSKGTLYVGSSETFLKNGMWVRGSLRAINATTGHVNWVLPLHGKVIGPPAVAGNIVAVTSGDDLVVAKTTNGQLLFRHHSNNLFWGGPTIAEGRIFAGNNLGTLFAFGLPLSASARSNVPGGPAPLNVSFAATAAGGARGYAFDWDFADGSHSLRQNPTHQFASPGTYPVTVLVTDLAGITSTATVTVVVTDVARPQRFPPGRGDPPVYGSTG